MTAFKLAVMTLFHPVTVSEFIKGQRGKRKSWISAAVLLLLTVAVRIFAIYFTHYPLSGVSVRKANVILECGKLLLPVITWVLASYAMTTILDGETLFSESIIYSCYCLMPYIVFTVPLTLFSRILDINAQGFYTACETILLAWVVMLMLTGLMQMNDYTPGKTVLVTLLTLFTMAVIWATLILLFTICSQFADMIKEMYYEVIYRLG